MLKDNLYTIEDIQISDSGINAELKLNNEHAIFKGHFPDVPVLPGVAMMQMIKELVELGEEQVLQISKAGNLKFLQMINPLKVDLLKVEISIIAKTTDIIKLKAQILNEQSVCFKMTGQLLIINSK